MDLENKLLFTRVGKMVERDKLGVWDWHVCTDMFKIDNQQGPTA